MPQRLRHLLAELPWAGNDIEHNPIFVNLFFFRVSDEAPIKQREDYALGHMPALKSERGVLAIDKRAALLAFATVTSSYTSLTTNSQVALEQLYQNTRTTQLLESYYQQWFGCGNDLVNYNNLATAVDNGVPTRPPW